MDTAEIRRLLSDNKIIPEVAEGLDDDTPLTLDSLALVWFQHVLEEEHGISIDPYGPDLDFFTSVRGIHTYLSAFAEGSSDAA